MCRTVTFVLLLVALTAGGAHAAPVSATGSAPAKVHRKTTATAASHATRHLTPAQRRHHAAPTTRHTQIQTTSTQKRTSHETGRTAGLAIRRELARKQAARRNVKLRVERSRAAARQENERERPIPSQRETRADAAMEVASASTPFVLRPAATEEPAPTEEVQRPETSVRPGTHAETPAPAEARSDSSMTNEELDAAERESSTTGLPTDDGNSPLRSEEASLRVPVGAMPAPLRGSLESLQRQNTRLDAEGLERIEDESDLEDRIAHKLLVPIPASSALTVNSELPATHRYCRPWTAHFLADLARAHDAAFHRPLEVSSAVRTMEYQKRLMEINGNAAPAEGDIVSPHLTGATVDIAKDGLSRDEVAWMRRRLLALETAGKIDVEEEFRQACFHITVYKSYAPQRIPRPASQAGSGSSGAKRRKVVGPSGADTQGL